MAGIPALSQVSRSPSYLILGSVHYVIKSIHMFAIMLEMRIVTFSSFHVMKTRGKNYNCYHAK